MATPSDHVLLRPFYDVVKWAKYALFQDKDDVGHSDKLTSLNQSSQLLLREGERALRRLTPLLATPSRQLTDFLKDLTLHNEDVVCQVRSIGILLYDFEDFIEAQTFDKAKFDELQAATKELAITLVEEITRFTTRSALESLPAPSQFPPLPPLPPLPNTSDTTRSSSQLSMRPSTNVSTSGSSYGRAQSRPSLTRGSEQRDRSHSAARALRAAGYSTSPSPISPNGLASPISLPFSSQSGIPEQEHETYRYIPTHLRKESNPQVITNRLQGLDIGAITPPTSITLSPKSNGIQSPVNPGTRGSLGQNYHDLPPSVTPDSIPEQDWSAVIDERFASIPRTLSTAAYQNTDPSVAKYRDSESYMPDEYSTEHRPSSFVPQGSRLSVRSDGSSAPSFKAATESSSSSGKHSASGRSAHSAQATAFDIGPGSSLSLLGGFCKGAQAFASRGPGQAIRKVGGGLDNASRPAEYSQEMLWGQMLSTSTEAYAEASAQCLHCEYKTPYSQLRQDMDQDPLASQQTRGIIHRSRFLYKSHMAVRSINSIFFGCLFCDRTKSTLQEDDATVFQSIDLLFRHISRHSHPLPHVPGVVVVYENRDANTRRRQDYDLSFPHSTMTTSPSALPAYDPDRIASLPSARATKDHIRRRNEKPQPRPDSVSEVLQFLAGAKIVGVEFPEKWGGKWCQGWHDRVFGTFPSNIITFELPQHVEIASLPRTPRTGVSRWKFEKQRQPGWLALRKGETIYNLACVVVVVDKKRSREDAEEGVYDYLWQCTPEDDALVRALFRPTDPKF
ncbi:Ff.00g040580.m01.CDS01 [Fusarium sp. VM40]|nr:Ff.00g040580.m01.CDS01 [Fusarium sp. VM40]